MAFFQYPTFEDWLKEDGFESRVASSTNATLTVARAAFEAARKQAAPVPAPKKTVLDQEEWIALRKDEGECGCTNCWNRYITHYGAKA